MGRGPGSTQRRVLDLLRGHTEGLLDSDLARAMHGPEPTRSQRQTVRRAVAAMVLQGDVSVASGPGALLVTLTAEGRAQVDHAHEQAALVALLTGPLSL